MAKIDFVMQRTLILQTMFVIKIVSHRSFRTVFNGSRLHGKGLLLSFFVLVLDYTVAPELAELVEFVSTNSTCCSGKS